MSYYGVPMKQYNASTISTKLRNSNDQPINNDIQGIMTPLQGKRNRNKPYNSQMTRLQPQVPKFMAKKYLQGSSIASNSSLYLLKQESTNET